MWSIDSVYFVFLASGFAVGFGHCIGMCGPIVISFSLHLKDRPTLLPHLYYNVGRTLTYGILGAVMGATASFTRFAADVGGFQKGVMIFAGILIILMGLGMTGWISTGRIFKAAPPVAGMISAWYRRLMQYRNAAIFLPAGMLLGFLPCGPVYTAMIAAARTGMTADSTLGGMLSGCGVMISFGIGTIPALLLLSRLSSVKWLRSRDAIYRVGGIIMVGTGVYFTYKGIVF